MLPFRRCSREFRFFFETSNGRFFPEHGSDRRETLAKRVSDDLQLFIFRRWNLFWTKKVQKILEVDFCFQEPGIWEELLV